MMEKPLTKQHSGTQTDTHFYESNIVSTYEWNEWELRRKAMKLVCTRSPAISNESLCSMLPLICARARTNRQSECEVVVIWYGYTRNVDKTITMQFEVTGPQIP